MEKWQQFFFMECRHSSFTMELELDNSMNRILNSLLRPFIIAWRDCLEKLTATEMEVMKIQFQKNLSMNESVKIERKPCCVEIPYRYHEQCITNSVFNFMITQLWHCRSIPQLSCFMDLICFDFYFDFLIIWVSKAKEQLLIVFQILLLIPIQSPCIVFHAPALLSPWFLDLRISMISSLPVSIDISIPVLNW